MNPWLSGKLYTWQSQVGREYKSFENCLIFNCAHQTIQIDYQREVQDSWAQHLPKIIGWLLSHGDITVTLKKLQIKITNKKPCRILWKRRKRRCWHPASSDLLSMWLVLGKMQIIVATNLKECRVNLWVNTVKVIMS